jgi:membrane-associated phospholipid phosphatase
MGTEPYCLTTVMSTTDFRRPKVGFPDSREIRSRLRVARRASLLLWAGALLAWLTHADRAVFARIAATPALQTLGPFGDLYSNWGLLLFYLPFLALLALGMRKRRATFTTTARAYLLAQAFGTVLLVHLIKLVTARPRPLADPLHDAFFQISGFADALHSSFPSSHAADAMVGAVFVSVLVRSRAAAILALAAALLMAVSRVLIGKHYLSDVLAGLALATGIVVIVMHVYLLPRWQKFEAGQVRRTADSSASRLAPARRLIQRSAPAASIQVHTERHGNQE